MGRLVRSSLASWWGPSGPPWPLTGGGVPAVRWAGSLQGADGRGSGHQKDEEVEFMWVTVPGWQRQTAHWCHPHPHLLRAEGVDSHSPQLHKGGVVLRPLTGAPPSSPEGRGKGLRRDMGPGLAPSEAVPTALQSPSLPSLCPPRGPRGPAPGTGAASLLLPSWAARLAVSSPFSHVGV